MFFTHGFRETRKKGENRTQSWKHRLAEGMAGLLLSTFMVFPIACEIDHGPVSTLPPPTPCPTVVQTPGVPAIPNCLFGLIVKYGCAPSCHAPGGTGAGYMVLTTPQLCYSQMVNVTSLESCSPASNGFEVLPGDAAKSQLILKLKGTSCVGTQMPLLLAPLTASEIQQFVDWINNGAPPGP